MVSQFLLRKIGSSRGLHDQSSGLLWKTVSTDSDMWLMKLYVIKAKQFWIHLSVTDFCVIYILCLNTWSFFSCHAKEATWVAIQVPAQ